MAASVPARLTTVLVDLTCNPNPQLVPDDEAVLTLLRTFTADELGDVADLATRLTNAVEEALARAGSEIANRRGR